MKPPQSVASFFVAAVLLVPPVRAAAPTESAHQLARRIAALANFHGGLIVHLGCGDGSLSAALRLTPNCVVHGLDADADNVASAQRRLHSLGLYGSVAVMHWQRPRLPYADNLATVVVWEDTRNFTSNEVWRV
ncbi:MAG: class I SAM-dependent methyltransferase, partial [Verrucomicrobiae bacterium]|nr:class I SAM-dependent methyltransferase [Verrucomicrobiae bacterium]